MYIYVCVYIYVITDLKEHIYLGKGSGSAYDVSYCKFAIGPRHDFWGEAVSGFGLGLESYLGLELDLSLGLGLGFEFCKFHFFKWNLLILVSLA